MISSFLSILFNIFFRKCASTHFCVQFHQSFRWCTSHSFIENNNKFGKLLFLAVSSMPCQYMSSVVSNIQSSQPLFIIIGHIVSTRLLDEYVIRTYKVVDAGIISFLEKALASCLSDSRVRPTAHTRLVPVCREDAVNRVSSASTSVARGRSSATSLGSAQSKYAGDLSTTPAPAIASFRRISGHLAVLALFRLFYSSCGKCIVPVSFLARTCKYFGMSSHKKA